MADARSGSHHSLLDLALLKTSRGATAQGCGTRAGLTTTKVPSSAEVGDPDPIRQRSSNPAQMRSSQAETCFRRTVGDGLKMSVAGPGCVKTFFLPQKLHATGNDPRRHDDLSRFLLYRVRSQPGRKLGLR